MRTDREIQGTALWLLSLPIYWADEAARRVLDILNKGEGYE